MKTTVVKVRITTVEHEILKQLVRSGLYGRSLSDAIERIVAKELWNHIDKPLIKDVYP